MMRPLNRSLMLGLAALAAASPAGAEDLSTREREAQSARAADRTVRRDLLSIFKPVEEVRSGQRVQLGGVGLDTPPYGTGFQDLCQKDGVALLYAPVESGGEPRDAGLKAYGISAWHEFRFLRPPPDEVGYPEGETDVWNGACRAADDRAEARWFSARDDLEAIQGTLVFRAAVKAFRDGTLRAQGCEYYRNEADCRARFLEVAREEAISSIESCETDDHQALCYVIRAGTSYQFAITAAARSDVVAPGAVRSIRLTEFIVVD